MTPANKSTAEVTPHSSAPQSSPHRQSPPDDLCGPGPIFAVALVICVYAGIALSVWFLWLASEVSHGR